VKPRSNEADIELASGRLEAARRFPNSGANRALYGIMSLRIYIIISILFSIHAGACPLEGYWKSDEQKTLDSFRKAEDATDKQKDLFENGFFGKLYIHYECTKFTSAMDGALETRSYELISSNNNTVTVKYGDEIKGEVVREIQIEGECYSLPVNEGQFREYFCPISKEAYNRAIKSMRRAAPDGQ
jgi:hypothetical protein